MFHKTSELFEFNKMLFIYLITGCVITLWITKIIILKKIILLKSDFFIPIILFLISQIVSTYFSIDRHTSFFGFYGRFNGGLLSTLSYCILFFAFISNISRDLFLKKWLNYILLSGVISAVGVVLWGLPGKFGYDISCFVFTGIIGNFCWTEAFRPAERMFSTLGQPNWLGAYLAFWFCISLFYLDKFFSSGEKSILKKTFSVSAVFLIASGILFSRSRSALLAIGIILILGLIISFFKKAKLNLLEKGRQFIVGTLVIIFLASVFLTGIAKVDKYLRPVSFFEKNSASKEFQENNKKSLTKNSEILISESGDIRKIVWNGAIKLAKLYPFFGTGVETFGYSYYFVRPKEHNLTSEWDYLYNRAHNEFLNIAATSGLFGILTYLFFIGFITIWVLRVVLKEYIFNNSENGSVVFSLFLGWLTIHITNFFGFSTTTISTLLFLVPALLFYFKNFEFENSVVKEKDFNQANKILFVVPIFTFIATCYFVFSYIKADMYFALGDNYGKINEHKKAVYYIQKALSYKNEHVYMDKISYYLANLALAAFSSKDKNAQSYASLSLFYNEKAIKQSPRNVLYYKTASKIYFLLYQIDSNPQYLLKALDSLHEAQKLAPTDPKIFYSRAIVYSLLADIASENKDKKKFLDNSLKDALKTYLLKPNFKDGYILHGKLLEKYNKIKEAKELYEYYLKHIDPEDSEIKGGIERLSTF